MGGQDYSAIIVLAKKDKDYYVVVSDIEHKDSDMLIRDIIAYAQKYNFCNFVYEANNFQHLLVTALEKEAQEKGISINITPVKNSVQKYKRISSLYPWIKNGSIKFRRSDKLLLEQFRMFPKGEHDDGPDALEMAMGACCRENIEPLDFYISSNRDCYANSIFFQGWDPDDRTYLGFDDYDGPSPNAKEIKVL